jgi:hypothetical protein
VKWILWALIFLAFFTPIVYIGKGVDHLDIMKDRYKRALDAGVSSAARAISYSSEGSLELIGNGFGEEEQSSNNIYIDTDNAMEWFYRVFYRNLGIEKDETAQQNIKRYIPMKAIASFDKLMIADVNDSWIEEYYYIINYNGTSYQFTMSDQVMMTSTGQWGRDVDFGISPATREKLINDFIRNKLNAFLNDREIADSNLQYYINITADDPQKTEVIRGISFIAMAEGMPLPTLNPFKNEKFYAFALGGTEIYRKTE